MGQPMEKPDTILATRKCEDLDVVYEIQMKKLKGREGYLLKLAYAVGGGLKTELACEVGEPFKFLQAVTHLAPTLR
jgi:hypothetical protein